MNDGIERKLQILSNRREKPAKDYVEKISDSKPIHGSFANLVSSKKITQAFAITSILGKDALNHRLSCHFVVLFESKADYG